MSKDYTEMSKEELLELVEGLKDIKNEAFQKRDEYKAENKALLEKMESFETKMADFEAKQTQLAEQENKAIVNDMLKDLDIQDKFKEDFINKSGITPGMDEKDLNEAVSKTLETYPEYRTPIQKTVEIKEKTQFNMQEAYANLIKGK